MKHARKRAGLTQAQLAEELGAAAITIRQYEQGKRQPRMEQLLRLSLLLHTDSRIDIQDFPDLEKSLGQLSPEAGEKAKSNFLYIGEGAHAAGRMRAPAQSVRLARAFNRLNEKGQRVAIDRMEELAEIPKYRRRSGRKAPD